MKIPLLLEPHNVRLPWGSEQWVVSARHGAASKVRNGQYAGKGLDEVMATEGVNLIGTKSPTATIFPLLMKVIDAKTSLSLQVHPNDITAPILGGEPKSEAWYVISADNENVYAKDGLTASIMAGIKDHVGPEEFMQSVLDGSVERNVIRYPVNQGDMCYIPGGTVHAIGGGVKIFEVQQTSETTYRLFDWNRVDEHGNARELKIAHGISSINWQAKGADLHRKAIGTPYFTMRELDLDGRFQRALDEASFRAYFVVEGCVDLTSSCETVHAERSDAVIIPADAGEFEIVGKAKIVVVTL